MFEISIETRVIDYLRVRNQEQTKNHFNIYVDLGLVRVGGARFFLSTAERTRTIL